MKKKDRLIKKAQRDGCLQQVAALPYRITDRGGIDVLVVTSRRTKRLIVPKGWPMPGKADCTAAAIEADEEAGVKGRIGDEPIGSFSYMKDLGSDAVRVTAHVFPLKVKKVKAHWKECKARKRKWLPAKKAAAKLDDRELGDLVNLSLPSLMPALE